MLIYACDGYDQLGQITDWSDLSITERDQDVGTWSIRVPLDGHGAEVVRRWLGETVESNIEVYDPDTGWRFGGPAIIRGYEITSDAVTAVLSGVDWMCILARRIYINTPDPALDGISETSKVFAGSGVLTSELHEIAASQLDSQYSYPDQSYRHVAGISGVFEDDPAGGTVSDYRIPPGTVLLDLMRKLAGGAEYTFRLRLDRRIVNGAEVSSVRWSTPERLPSNTRLSVAAGGYEQATVKQTRAPSTMTIAVGSEVDPNYRLTLISRQLTTRWGNTLHGEDYLDFNGYTDTETSTEQHAAFVESFPKETIRFDGVDISGWGREVDIGWYVAAEIGVGGQTRLVDLPVGSSTLTGPPGELTRSITVGEYEPEGVDLMMQLIRGLGNRVRTVERRA